ncbi:hypothetical protein [Actinomarinicola tropica]|uniref:hypothetical protein n=1 Tax=Actinomarinicola tropica TaxID=2789776 RepID=UPI001E5A0320|nr:hypothetical protein [Actinomarinicola tropica]
MSDDDDARLAAYADDLARGVRDALPAWTVRCVVERLEAWTGAPPGPDVVDAARAAGEQARAEVGDAVSQVLAADIDEQRVPPLALLRGAVRYPTEVLRAEGVPPVVRDEFAERAFPDDVYDLAPANFADLDPALHEPGMLWGAAKAHVHLQRRRADGQR